MVASSSTEERNQARAAVQGILNRYHKLAAKVPGDGVEKLFDLDCMDRVELVDAGPEGSVVFRFKITQRYANLNGM